MVLEEHSGLLRVGERAPNALGRLSKGETIALADYIGKRNVVLFFYPKDFTPGCTKQVCSYRDNYARLLGMDAVVFGISYDDERSHDLFAQRYGLPFPLISDTTGDFARAYGVTRFGGSVLPAKRVTYVIDKEGIVRSVSHYEVFIERHVEKALETLKRLAVETKI